MFFFQRKIKKTKTLFFIIPFFIQKSLTKEQTRLPYLVFALRFCTPLPVASPQYTAWLVADKFVNNERREVGKVHTGAVT
jgi:hypothetical protein